MIHTCYANISASITKCAKKKGLSLEGEVKFLRSLRAGCQGRQQILIIMYRSSRISKRASSSHDLDVPSTTTSRKAGKSSSVFSRLKNLPIKPRRNRGNCYTITTYIKVLIGFILAFIVINEKRRLLLVQENTISPTLNEKTRTSDLVFDKWGFHPEWHPLKRSDRFPSIEERLKVYMGNWYLPPCNGSRSHGSIDERLQFEYDYSNNKEYPSVRLSIPIEHYTQELERSSSRYFNLTLPTFPQKSKVTPISVIWERNLWDKRHNEKCSNPYIAKSYCPDLREIVKIFTKLNHAKNLSHLPPIISFQTDNPGFQVQQYGVPAIQKARYSTMRDNLEYVTSEESRSCSRLNRDGTVRKKLIIPPQYLRRPEHKDWYHGIIWPLNYKRHFDPERFDSVRKLDIPWENKIGSAVWRGATTGKFNILDANGKKKSFEDSCDSVPRCLLVKKYANSTIVDVGFSTELDKTPIPIHMKYMVKDTIEYTKQLGYKAIIMIEGNDVASGLKWALLSRSVVIMPTPTKTSYAMEELLQPWIHYIPIDDRLSDVEDKMKWVIDHDEEANKIAERGSLFIMDLLFHKKSSKENEKIKKMILRRYLDFFVT